MATLISVFSGIVILFSIVGVPPFFLDRTQTKAFLTGWMAEWQKWESRMTPRLLVWATGRQTQSLTDLGRAVINWLLGKCRNSVSNTLRYLLGNHMEMLSKYLKMWVCSPRLRRAVQAGFIWESSAYRWCACTWVLRRVQLFEIPWTVDCQSPLSMEFSRQAYWSRLPFPFSVDLLHPEIKPMSLVSPALADRFSTTLPPGKPDIDGT